MDYVPDYDLAY